MAGSDILTEYLDEWQRKPFDWKAHNCGHFVCGWVERKAGVPGVASELLGRFVNQVGCWRVLRREGFPSLTQLAAVKLGQIGKRRPDGEHQEGDIVTAFMPDGREVFGVSTGEFIASPSERGLIVSRAAKVHAAWEI